jgi:hypothetical protein
VSGRREKALRRAEGLSPAARDAQREFEAQVARVRLRNQRIERIERAASVIDAALPAPRRDTKRRVLALFVLWLFFTAIGLCVAAALGAQ